jgi:hypothetical protein
MIRYYAMSMWLYKRGIRREIERKLGVAELSNELYLSTSCITSETDVST